MINFILILLLIYHIYCSTYSVTHRQFVPGNLLGLLCLPKLATQINTLSIGVLLLLLYGDIELNPGDVAVFPCCSEPVLDSTSQIRQSVICAFKLHKPQLLCSNNTDTQQHQWQGNRDP